MSLRPAEVALLLSELSSLKGAIVQKTFAPLPKLCYLELRQVGRSVLLCLSAEGDLSRIAVVEERFPSPTEASGFQQKLRSELTGARLTSLAFDPEKRTFELVFERETHQR